MPGITSGAMARNESQAACRTMRRSVRYATTTAITTPMLAAITAVTRLFQIDRLPEVNSSSTKR